MRLDQIGGRVVHVLLGCTFILGVGCGKDPAPEPSTPSTTTSASDASVIDVAREVTAWTSVDNGFTKDCTKDTPDSPYNRLPREGVLIQLGTYTDLTGSGEHTMYSKMVIGTDEYPKTTGFYWIQVVSDMRLPDGEPEPKSRVPLEETHGKYLYPNTTSSTSPDFPCYGDAACCTRKLHPLMDPEALLTLWGGTKGYRISAEPLPGEPWRVRLHFLIDDPVEIRVFRATNPAGDFALEKTYDAGRYTIDVVSVDPDKHNDIDDPPWP